MGERWGFAEPQQDLIRLFSPCAAASFSVVQLSNRDLSIKLRDESRALLAMRAFITNLSLSSQLASRLGSYTGLWISLFFVYFH